MSSTETLTKNMLHSIGLQAEGDAYTFYKRSPKATPRHPTDSDLDYAWRMAGEDIVKAYRMRGEQKKAAKARYREVFLAVLKELYEHAGPTRRLGRQW